MRLSKLLLSGLLAVALLAIMAGTGWNAKKLDTDNIHLRGSGNIAPIAQKIAEIYMQENPGTVVTVTASGTMRGYKALLDATCNIAMTSADWDEKNEKKAKDNEMNLTAHVIAKDALVPIVNSRNSVKSLSLEDLRKIFSGEITNWQQLGGENEPVLLASHDGTSGNYETWKEKVMGTGKIVTPKAKIMASDEMKAYVQQNPGAIGYLGMSYLDNAIKPLAVEGIIASKDSVKNGSYPVVRDLKLYTTQYAPESVAKFIAYFENAEKGQKFVEQAGLLPVQ